MKLNRNEAHGVRLTVGACLLSLVFSSPATMAEETAKLDDENARINYAVGYQVGGDFRRQGVELDPEIMARAVEDALSGNPPAMSPAERRKALTDLQQRVVAERQAKSAQASAVDLDAQQAFLAANRAEAGVQVTDNGLQYKIITEGSGKRPGPTDTVRVHYRGTKIDGSEFDSSYKRGKPAEFRLDKVIKGWTEGLQLMQEGARYELVVPAELAYGDRGRLANQTLIFEVELLEVNPES